jgi:hypothetical protein
MGSGEKYIKCDYVELFSLFFPSLSPLKHESFKHGPRKGVMKPDFLLKFVPSSPLSLRHEKIHFMFIGNTRQKGEKSYETN